MSNPSAAFFCRGCFVHKLVKCQSSTPKLCLSCEAKMISKAKRSRFVELTHKSVGRGAAIQKFKIEHGLDSRSIELAIKRYA